MVGSIEVLKVKHKFCSGCGQRMDLQLTGRDRYDPETGEEISVGGWWVCPRWTYGTPEDHDRYLVI